MYLRYLLLLTALMIIGFLVGGNFQVTGYAKGMRLEGYAIGCVLGTISWSLRARSLFEKHVSSQMMFMRGSCLLAVGLIIGLLAFSISFEDDSNIKGVCILLTYTLVLMSFSHFTVGLSLVLCRSR